MKKKKVDGLNAKELLATGIFDHEEKEYSTLKTLVYALLGVMFVATVYSGIVLIFS